MTKPWRLLVMAAAVNLMAGIATAQTVVVRHAPVGETIDVVVNEGTATTGTVDTAGDATVTGKMHDLGKTEMDANIFVDTCDNKHRVLIAERGLQPPVPEASCRRREISGVYWVRVGSTVVVDVGGPNPTVLLRQGRYSLTDPVGRKALPGGLQIFAGSGLVKFRDAVSIACGNVSPCTTGDAGFPYAVGATFWFSRFVGVEASYMRPSRFEASGSGAGYRFDSSLDLKILTIGGKVGVGAGPVRFYGTGGVNYQQSDSSTTQTFDDKTITVDNVVQTIPGGTQTLVLRTEGWGWQVGGGLEIWLKGPLAVYTEVGRLTLKGSPGSAGEGRFDERANYLFGGVRLHLGK